MTGTPDAKVVAVLKAILRVKGNQRAAAAAIGISQAYFNDLVRGRRQAGPKVLDALGFVRVSRVIRREPTA